jgi:hypothetical protein
VLKECKFYKKGKLHDFDAACSFSAYKRFGIVETAHYIAKPSV